jgi:hypothetical protein
MQAGRMAGLHVRETEAYWTTVCKQYTTASARMVIAALVRNKE